MRHPKVRALCWLVVLVLALPFGARPSAAANSWSSPPAAPAPRATGQRAPGVPGPAALPPPFSVAPGQLARTLSFGQAVTDTRGLTLTNPTTRPLTVTISELAGGFRPLSLQSQPPAPVLVVNQQAPQASAAAVSVLAGLGYAPEAVDNADFEGRAVSNLLTYAAVVYLGRTGTTDTNPSNTKLTAYLDAGGRLLIMDNDLGFYVGASAFYRTYLDATFGADEPDPDGGSVAQTGFDIMAGLSVPSADTFPDTFTTGASSTPILRYVFDNSVGGSRIARNSYKAVYVASDLHLLGTVAPAEQIERDIVGRSLGWLLGNPAADNLPWLAEAPAVVSLPPSSSVNVAISWNATRLEQPGVYTGTLRLSASEAPADPVNVPVQLTVNPNASQGQISGTVTSRGLCDNASAPLAGAAVRFQSGNGTDVSVVTDASGRYVFFGAAGTYSISTGRADHVPSSNTATLAAGDSLTRDFALRLDEPCVGVAPASLSASLLIGQQLTRTITISNTGAAALQFGLSELPATQSGGPDGGGYGWSLLPASWVDASDGFVHNPDDDGAFNLTLPFAFPFYDRVSNQLRVGNNGAILVGATAGDIDSDNLPIANPAAPDYLIAPFWDDLSADGGQIYVRTLGSAPSRRTVVQWNDRPHYGSAGGIGAASFQVVFFESGSLLFQYRDVDFGNAAFNNGASATVGLRGAGAGRSLQYSYNAANLQANQALCLPRPGAAACNDVPWLRESPTSGTVPLTASGPGQPVSTQAVSVVFDARGLSQAGTYSAKLVIGHDGLQPAVAIPVSLEVAPPTSAGLVSGSVEGLRGCDLPGAGLANAQVRFTSGGQSTTATTDSTGSFSMVLPAGSYSVNVSAAGYATVFGNATVAAGSQQIRNYSLRPNLPCLALPASSVTSLQAPGQVVTRALAINNTGLASLSWALTERAPALAALTGPAPARQAPAPGGAAQPAPAQAPAAEQVQDGGFEATVAAGTNQFWTQTSSNFSGVLCNQSRCGDGGGAGIGPRSGGWFAWFGGLDEGMGTEVGTLSQNVVIPSGATTLSFWLRIAGSSQRAGDALQVVIDSTQVLEVNAQATGYGSYRLVNVPISQFANGASHRITFRGTVQEGDNTNFLVDDVSLDPAVRSCVADALPWVSVSPASGSVAAGGSASVAVAFNSAGLAPGTYAGTLCLSTNDSQRPEVSIPLTLTVRDQQSFPKLYLPLLFKP